MLYDLGKLWAILTPTDRRKAVWMLVLMVLVAGTESVGVLSIMPFLSVLSRPGIVHENAWLLAIYEFFGFSDTRDFIFALGLASIAVVVVASGFKTITHHFINRFVHLQRHAISSRLLSRYLHQPYEFFLSRHSAELSKNILSETDQLLFGLFQPISQLLAQGVVVLAMAVLIFWYDPWMAICILAALAVLYAVIYTLVRKRLARTGRERELSNRRRYQTCQESLGGIKDVKVTDSAAAYLEQFNHASRLYSRHLAAGETISQSPLYLVEAAGYTGLIAIALLLLYRTNDIAHVLPALGLYGFAAYRLLPAAQIIYRGFARLKFSAATLDKIHHDLTLPEDQRAAKTSALVPRRDIRLDGIRYAYPSTPDAPIFEDFNLVIPANTSIGIAGKSGAGKTTLMDLLLGLLRPQIGSLSVDGVRIDGTNVGAWQRAIGYVPQHVYLADASVAENIGFGVPRELIDMRAVERAARAAQIHEFVINELPQGYDTAVGERGIRLSGGQRQRIGVARALYRDPPVLFFDEATSALDTQTEAELNEAVRHLSGRKTIIVIAHKAESLRTCQMVISLPAFFGQAPQVSSMA